MDQESTNGVPFGFPSKQPTKGSPQKKMKAQPLDVSLPQGRPQPLGGVG